MLPHLKVGHLVPGCVVKSLPDHESYLVLITNTETLAFLPKKYTYRTYKIGDELTAAVFILDAYKIILSQKNHHFFRRLAEEIFHPLIMAGKVRIRRAATVMNGHFAKISIESLNGMDPVSSCLPYLKQARLYTNATITLVKYSQDMTEYIQNSFAPAPRGKITKVIYSHNNREAIVKVSPEYVGKFAGKGGANVAAAAKLLDINIRLTRSDEEIPPYAEHQLYTSQEEI